MDSKKRIGAVITAAGMSTRMGKLKQTLPFAGRTVIETVVGHFADIGVSPIVIVAGYRADEVRACLSDYPVVILENKDYEHTQMLDSVKIGLEYIADRCDRCFFTPVDIPAFRTETLLSELSREEPLVFPVVRGKTGHPILFDQAVIREILKFDGEDGLRGAISGIDADKCYLQVDDEGALMDADTPEEYRKLVEMYEKRLKEE